MSAVPLFIGIDVAKAQLDVALRPTGERWAVGNDDTSIAALVARLQAMHPTLIVLEATGGYQRAVVAALAAAGLPVAVVNPRQARGFAKATGQLAKTDALDARALAHFAEAVRPPPRPLPDAQADALRALLARRRQLVAMRTAEQNRLGSAPARLQADIQAHITWLNTRLAALDDDLDTTLRASPVWGGGGEARKGRADRLYAQTVDDPECPGETPHILATSGGAECIAYEEPLDKQDSCSALVACVASEYGASLEGNQGQERG